MQARHLTAFFFLLLVCLLPPGIAWADTLSMGAWNAPPYVIIGKDGEPDGMSIQVWKSVAERAGLDFKIYYYRSLPDILDDLDKGKLDGAIGPVAMSADKAEKYTFTIPYYTTCIAFMTRAKPPTLWDRVKPLLTKAFFTAAGGILVVLLIVGHLLWLFEYRHNPEQFPATWLHGVGHGMWLALSVMTTVGFGDIVPKTKGGKIVCSIWMIISMVTASTLTAGLASVLTTIFTLEYLPGESYSTPAQICQKKVVLIEGTNTARILGKYGKNFTLTDSVPEAIGMLSDGTADVFAFDHLALEYYLKLRPGSRLAISPYSMRSVSLAFMFTRQNQKAADDFDVALLKMLDEGSIEGVIDSWLATVYQKRGRAEAGDAEKNGNIYSPDRF
ncbi:MAG: transporter substrate-binding domain-containing protein [Candidatus Eremiobacteraeota bacterium]|nr:transporter substrate-binding domain-containing protein [Candidatus Eremiobacteraeota bacterium]